MNKRTEKIPLVDLKAQYLSIKPEIDQAIQAVIQDTAFIGGQYLKQFEDAFSGFCTAKHCIGVGNGSDALYIALRALGVGKGHEVITVANSFIATAEAISMAGAKVVFVDCDPETYTIDVKQVTGVITERTKAIIAVHLYGHPADMGALKKVADEHGLYLIEDAAQAHGGGINGRRVGTFGHLACFSFYPGKNLGAYGDGGAITTDSDELSINCRMIANHGRTQKYDHEFEGVSSRLDGLQAAILNVKLRYLERWNEKRRAIAALYGEVLSDSEVITPLEREGFRHVYHLYVVRVKNRDHVRATMQEENISTGIHYPIALPHLQAYRYLNHGADDFSVALKCSQDILSLPIYPELRREQVEYICEQLKTAVKR